MKRALFVGWYPNPIDEYRNVFFRNLIYEMAKKGVECTVISPVSVIKYGWKISRIPKHFTETVADGVIVSTYYPRAFSASSIQIGSFNTEVISEWAFEHAALSCANDLVDKFDFVYGHFFLYGGLAAVKIGRKLRIPAFIAYGECDFESQVRQSYGVPKAKVIKGLCGIIAVSTKNAKELDEIGFIKGIPMIVIPNSTDLTLFYPRDRQLCRRQLNISEDKFVVGFVGGFIERKGDKRLLAAASKLDGVYLAFAGKGKAPEGDKVIYCKALNHDDVPILLNAVDVFCLPTLSEGSCNAIVEAMACGAAIISSNLPFNDDVLNEENSIRINPNSIDEIRDAIVKLKEDAVYRASISRHAQEDSKKFDIGRRTERILSFIESISSCY